MIRQQKDGFIKNPKKGSCNVTGNRYYPPRIAAGAALSGRSSVVEHNLAKVGVEGSNLFARSIFPQ